MAFRTLSKPAVRPARAARAAAVAPRADAGPVKRAAAAAAAFVLTLGMQLGGASIAYAAPARPTLGALEEELERVEPAVADAAPSLTKTLGAREVTEIEAEVRAIEAATDALDEKAADAVGAETKEIDAAAAPLLARIEAVRELVGLAGAKE